MIRLEHVRKRYPNGHEALRGINLHVSPAEMVFLTGHSGAGKSTLLKLIALLERPSAGKIVFEKKNLALLSPKEIPFHRRRVGVIFQNPTLLNDRSVFDNVALPLQISGFNESEIKHRVNASLELVSLLNKAQKQPNALSGGEQQRVGIARAIVSRPEVILADEPTGNLDPQISKDIMYLFSRLNQVGITLIIATHDLSLVNELNHRQIELKDGRVLEHDNASSTHAS